MCACVCVLMCACVPCLCDLMRAAARAPVSLSYSRAVVVSPCSYTLLFASAYGCADFVGSQSPTMSVTPSYVPSSSPSASPTPPFIPKSHAPRSLSGGWIFVFLLVCGTSGYLLIGMFISYRRTGVWEPPHRHFWSSAFGYVDDGVDFIINCDRRRRGDHGGVPGASPFAPASGGGYNVGAAQPSAPGAGSYQASSSAYTDL